MYNVWRKKRSVDICNKKSCQNFYAKIINDHNVKHIRNVSEKNAATFATNYVQRRQSTIMIFSERASPRNSCFPRLHIPVLLHPFILLAGESQLRLRAWQQEC